MSPFRWLLDQPHHMLLGLLRLVQIVELAEQARDDLAVEQLIELIGDGNELIGPFLGSSEQILDLQGGG
jgi:hypothetical protein